MFAFAYIKGFLFCLFPLLFHIKIIGSDLFLREGLANYLPRAGFEPQSS
jgi:hypothetical protein